MSHLISDNVHVVENDQDAINAAYQVADFALEGRNERDQKRQLPFAEIDLFSQKGLGGIRIPQNFGGAIKRWRMFFALSIKPIPAWVKFHKTRLPCST